MPGDAIERARQIMIEELRKAGCRAPLDPMIQPFLQAGVRAALAFASQQAPEGWREKVRHLDLALSDGIDAASSAPAGLRIQMLAATIRDARLAIRAMLDAAPSVTLGES